MRRFRLYQTFIFVGLFFVFSLTAMAQSKLDSLQHLDEVVVTAIIPKEIIPVQILSGVSLEKLSAHSVADAVRFFSGVQIKDYGGVGGLKTVDIRSMGTNHVGIFYDGIELGNAQNGTVDLGRFSLDNMEMVSVYNGQKSSIFQSAKDFASAGTIYLQSRTPSFEKQEKYHFRTTFRTGSFDVINPSFLWEQRLNARLSSSLSAEYTRTSGKYKFTYATKEGYDTTAVRHNGDVEAMRVEAGLYGKMDEGYWKTKAYFYSSERGYPGAIVRNKFMHEDRQWDTNAFVQGSFKKDLGKIYSLLLNGKLAYDYLYYLADDRKDNAVMYISNRYYQSEAYFSVANRFQIFPFWEVNLSVDYQWNKLDANLVDFAYPRRHSLLTALATSFHFRHFKLQASLLNTYAHENVLTHADAAHDKNELTPFIVMAVQPFNTSNFNLRFFYKKIFRLPTLNELYYTFIGNTSLNPEYTSQYNIGATYNKNFAGKLLESITLEADAYYNKVRNKISAIPTSNFFRWSMVNLGLVKIKGVDASLQTDWAFNRDIHLNARLSYTYQDAGDYTDRKSEFYGGQIPYIPWHSGSMIFNGNYKRWEMNYSFIYVGERYMASANTIENDQLPWYTSDLSFARSFNVKKLKCKVTLEINNLLNQQFEVVRSYPMPGRNYKLILNVNI